jgi:YidC/Oxa1 family membrane protein insertase
MDKKNLLQMFLIAILAFLAMEWYLSHIAAPQGSNSTTTTQPTTNSASRVVPLVSIKPQTWTLGSAEAGKPYKLALVISNISAGVQSVQLNAADYRQEVGSDEPLTLLDAQSGDPLPFSTQMVTINNQPYNLDNQAWTIEQKTDTQEVLELELTDINDQPVVSLIKTFQIDPTSYDVLVTMQIQNLTKKPIQTSATILGPTNLLIEDMQDKRMDSRNFQSAGYTAASHYLDTTGFPQVYQRDMLGAGVVPKVLGDFTGPNQLLWIASSNRFFTVITRPLPAANEPITYDTLDNGQQIPQINYLDSAQLERVGPNATAADPMGVSAVVINSATMTVAPGSSKSIPLSVYLGPKKRSLLAGSLAAPMGSDAYEYNLYDYMAVIQFGQGSAFRSFFTFSWLALAILWLLDLIHIVVDGNYGIAIMVLVLAVRLLLHPLTRYGQVQMTKMQRKMAQVQPEMDRIRKKYSDDKARQQQEMMRLYKEYNINPAAGVMGCLPMLLQMPIWIALYSGLSVDIDLRQAGFIPGWITDLSNPDTLANFHTSFYVPIFGYTFNGQDYLALNLLPILLGVAFFFQMRYQMKLAPVPTDPQQRQTQMITQYMVLIFPVFLYNAPSGLNLYICASTLGGLIDTWLVRRHLKTLEDRGIIQPRLIKK